MSNAIADTEKNGCFYNVSGDLFIYLFSTYLHRVAYSEYMTLFFQSGPVNSKDDKQHVNV